jgi:hypothetical protein
MHASFHDQLLSLGRSDGGSLQLPTPKKIKNKLSRWLVN